MKGNQIPRIKIEPNRTATDGKGASMLMKAYGVELDEWQRLIIDCWLGKDESGEYTVTSAGLSVPRQNGKNVCIEAREFYGLVINGEKILHTAHQVSTYKKAFRRLMAMFRDKKHPEIVKAVKKIREGVGEESIELVNGGLIEFKARSRQSARGFDGISLVVFDEAQEASDEQAEAILSVLSASATGTRQIIYAGTPPYTGCNGEVFRRFRQACITASGKDEEIHNSWHEWSISSDNLDKIDFSNRELWFETNPALGYRLTEEFTEEEFKTLSPLGFARERLGMWSKPASEQSDKAIDPRAWNACKSSEQKPEGKTAYGVKFSADGSLVVLAGATIPTNGKGRITVIEVRQTGHGITWLAEWLNERYKIASVVVIDGKNGADLLVDKIHDTWKFKDSVMKPSARDVVNATALLINEINEQSVTWFEGQDGLNESALSAVKRPIAGGWGFGGMGSELIEACSLALYGCRNSKRNPQRKMRIC